MQEKNTFIVRCGEVALKGMNKPYFERMLVERIRKVLKKSSSSARVLANVIPQTRMTTAATAHALETENIAHTITWHTRARPI